MKNIFAVLLITGCVWQKEAPSSPKIINGMPVKLEDVLAKSVIAILDDNGVTRSVFGSGVLISSKKILTAAHNFHPEFTEARFDSALMALPGAVAKKENTRIHPAFLEAALKYGTPQGLNFPVPPPVVIGDIAVVDLAQELTAPFAPLNLASEKEVADAKDFLVLGFGWSTEIGGRGGQPSTTLYSLPMVRSTLVGSSLDKGEIALQPLAADQGICAGDSGGPALLKTPTGEFKVVGVLSRGAAGKCAGGWAIYTLAYFHSDFIAR